MNDELTEEVYLEELKQFEKVYYKQLYKKDLTPDVQFQYARCLVRSRYPADIKKGILFLEELSSTHFQGRGEYYYYLAIGNARIREYTKALKYVKSAISLDPNNKQIIKLESLIKNRMDRENLITMSLTGGVMLFMGACVAVVMTLLK